MLYIATFLLSLMTLGLIICGILLWRCRKETHDYSRTIQAIFSWVSAFFAFTFIFRTWAGNLTVDGAFLEPEHTFVPIFIQMIFFLYPLEVMKPLVNPIKVYILLFTPLLAIAVVGMCAGIVYTPIHTYEDLWAHIAEPNVLFRLFALIVMLFYSFSLFLVRYDWRQSSADRNFIRMYAIGFCLIGLLHFTIQVTHSYVAQLMHQLVWMAFFFSITYYELKERLVSTAKESQPDTVAKAEGDELWQRIVNLMDEEGGWYNPEISQSYLATRLFSNRTYIGDAFKRNTGMSFRDYQIKRRIDYVVHQLRLNPRADVQELFFRMGYRDRSTAWRNFRKIMGVSPSEFVDTLK